MNYTFDEVFARYIDKSNVHWRWKSMHGNHTTTVRVRGATRIILREIYKKFVGELKPREVVFRKCKDMECYNPAHLMVGTPQEAAAYYHQTGNKLTPQEAEKIRKAYAAGKTSLRAIGQKYGVSATTVNSIVLGRTYSASRYRACVGKWTHINDSRQPHAVLIEMTVEVPVEEFVLRGLRKTLIFGNVEVSLHEVKR